MSSDLFSKFSAASLDEPIDEKPALAHNYCDDCVTPMELHDSEYHCPNCGIIVEYLADAVTDHSASTAGNIRISTGAHKGRFYNVSNDYSQSQLKLIMQQFTQLSNEYKGFRISPDILKSAAEAYNRVQRNVTVETSDGRTRKFVRRGVSKNAVLAAAIYYECIRAGQTRQPADIAQFMKLPNAGFSTGDNAYRTICQEHGFELPQIITPMNDFINRFSEALGLDPKYKGFIAELVETSEKKHIGMNSNISSKVVGAMYILITQLNLPFSISQLEVATNNTKKSTFTKFVGHVVGNMSEFRPVYKKWNIPTVAPFAQY